MKNKFKKQNSPRLQSAINQAIALKSWHWWYVVSAIEFWDVIFNICYKADKYDVLNRLAAPGNHTKIVTYCRGDIRHRRNTPNVISFLIFLELLLLWMSGLFDAG